MPSDHGVTPATIASALGKPQLHVDQYVIDRVVETVRDLCGWHVFPPRAETLTVETTGDYHVVLPTLNVQNVNKVTFDGVDVEGVDWSDHGILRFQRALPPAFRRLKVELTHGFELPKSLLGVVASMVERSDRFTGATTVGNITVGGTQIATPQSREWRILDRYTLEARP